MSRRLYTAADQSAAVALYQERHERGLTVADVCQTIGISKATLMRWVSESESEEAQAARRPGRPGRRPSHEFSEAEANALRWLRLKHGSLPLAVECFLQHEACRPESRQYLSTLLERAAAAGRVPSWPPCVRRAAHVSEDVEAQFRGDRAAGKYAPTIVRGAFWIDAQGREVPLLPHDIWESDDMSANEPFRYVDPLTGETKIGRQILFTSDRFSAAFIGLTLIGRDRDSYRAEDILDHLLDMVDVFGLPRLWRIERGVWESTAIDGVALDTARARQLGYVGDRWTGRRIGGLDALFRIEHMVSSNGKGGVESGFDHLQAHTAHASLHIGRERGEFEAAARQLRRAQNGIEAAQAKFWEAAEAAAGYMEAISRFNAQPKRRSMFGGQLHTPSDLLRTHAQPKRPLPDSERWRFHPRKQLAVVRGGVLSTTVDGRSFTWPAYGDGIQLEHGHRVVIAFHPSHPERGCTVVEAEFGPRNREGRPIGEPLFVAEPLEMRPQWDERDERDEREHPARRWKGQVRREFRAIRRDGQGEAPTKSSLSDGRGRAIAIESGFDGDRNPAAEAAPTPRRHTAAPSRRTTTPVLESEDLAALEEEALKFF